jgi:hypothetical protein
MIVHFRLNGVERTERVATKNANFARSAIEEAHPGAVVWLVLMEPKR